MFYVKREDHPQFTSPEGVGECHISPARHVLFTIITYAYRTLCIITVKKDYNSQVYNNLQELNKHYHYAIKQLLTCCYYFKLVNLSSKESGVLYPQISTVAKQDTQ